MKTIVRLGARLLRWACILVLVALVLLPFYWGLATSLKPTPDIQKAPPNLVPQRITFEHYLGVFRGALFQSVRNSLLTSGTAVLLGTSIAALAAYALYRYQFPGRNLYIVVLLTTMMITRIALIIPTYIMFSPLHLVDSHLGLALLYTAYALPFAILMIESTLGSVPRDLEDAALVDGCTPFQVIYKIIIPIIRPGVAAAALYVFVQSWNDFIIAAIMINTPAKMTMMPTVYNYIGFFGRDWGGLTAAAILSMVPLLVFFSALQRQFTSGLSAGAVRG